MKNFIPLVFLLTLQRTSAQFFNYYQSLLPQSPLFTPFIQPPLIPQPQFYFQPNPPNFEYSHDTSTQNDDNYLGYSYRTRHDDGASSTVVFFTGQTPSINYYSNNKNTPQINYENNKNNETNGVRVVSDLFDPQSRKSVEDNIKDVLKDGISEANVLNLPQFLRNQELPFGTFHYFRTPADTTFLRIDNNNDEVLKSNNNYGDDGSSTKLNNLTSQALENSTLPIFTSRSLETTSENLKIDAGINVTTTTQKSDGVDEITEVNVNDEMVTTTTTVKDEEDNTDETATTTENAVEGLN